MHEAGIWYIIVALKNYFHALLNSKTELAMAPHIGLGSQTVRFNIPTHQISPSSHGIPSGPVRAASWPNQRKKGRCSAGFFWRLVMYRAFLGREAVRRLLFSRGATDLL